MDIANWTKLGDAVQRLFDVDGRRLARHKQTLEDADVSFAFDDGAEAAGIKPIGERIWEVHTMNAHAYAVPQITHKLRDFVYLPTSQKLLTESNSTWFIVDTNNLLPNTEIIAHALTSAPERSPAATVLRPGLGSEVRRPSGMCGPVENVVTLSTRPRGSAPLETNVTVGSLPPLRMGS